MIVAIDGACRRNGKPDCLSAGSVFIRNGDEFEMYYTHENNSTNQRGELLALETALTQCRGASDDSIILITDSEYVFNAVSKDWIGNWRNKGWITSSGSDVKNKDIWERVGELLDGYVNKDIDIVPFHIKGHLFPFGKVTASYLLNRDMTGEFLYRAVRQKVTTIWESKATKIKDAKDLYIRNNGHEPPAHSFFEIVVCNTVADLAAGYHADLAELSRNK